MRPNFKHYTLLLLCFVAVIASGLAYWYFYNIVISNAQKHSFVLEEIIRDNENKKNEDKLIALGKEIDGDRQKLSSYFVTEDKILEFITSIEEIEKISSTTMNLSSINKEGTDHIKVNVEIKGPWLNINKALMTIENIPYSISIDTTNITLNAEGWAMTLNIKALATK